MRDSADSTENALRDAFVDDAGGVFNRERIPGAGGEDAKSRVPGRRHGQRYPVDTTVTPPLATGEISSAVFDQARDQGAEDDQDTLTHPDLYLNRELTWLAFNRRVLHEAWDERTPLLERIKFIAIVGSNLDEFFMKRIGGLKQQLGAGVSRLTVDGRTPAEQIMECSHTVREIEGEIEILAPDLLESLRDHGIRVTEFTALDARAQDEIRERYLRNIFPLVTPQAIDPAHPFPFISNLSLNLLVTVSHPGHDEHMHARVKVPTGEGIQRYLTVNDNDETCLVHLADVMASNLDLLFPGLRIIACERFHVTRNAITDSDDEGAEDLLEVIESELRSRHFAPIVRLVVERSMDQTRRIRLARELQLDIDADVFETDTVIPVSDLMQIANQDYPALRFPSHQPVDHARLEKSNDLFRQIRDAGPFLLHHPYESFSSSVERFLREASRDANVRAIKMTLYRTSRDTKVIDYLIDASHNGKQVAVVVELKARFDEAANIRWATRLEKAGIHVTYGVVGLKTHTKTVLVIRQDADGLRHYAHIGTGNYHAGTARLYSDLGILTCDPEIGRDMTELFNYLTTGFTVARHYRKLLAAPTALKRTLIEKIRREAEHAAKGETAHIRFKLNALEDPDITRELYVASRAGVKIELIIRDTCRLRPGIPGLSDSVSVISIVGRFLEHARIYYFRNGGADEYFIGSADAMTRNLESRVEVLTPVESDQNRHELSVMLELQLADQRSAWDMASDGSYRQRRPAAVDAEPDKGSQQRLIELAERRLQVVNRRRSRTVWPSPARSPSRR